MDPRLSNLFLNEIKKQCEFAISDYNDIGNAVSQKDNYSLFHSLQTFLVTSANISKILWPVRTQYYQRGQDLNGLLSIDDTSPLKTRDPRNIFEHFDEKLDDWFAKSLHHNLLDWSSGDRDDAVIGNIDYIRYFNFATYTFRFRGEMYEIRPIYNAIRDLLIKVNNELSKPLFTKFPP